MAHTDNRKLLRTLRRTKNITKEELADIMEITPEYLAHLEELDSFDLCTDTLKRIGDKLNLDIRISFAPRKTRGWNFGHAKHHHSTWGK